MLAKNFMEIANKEEKVQLDSKLDLTTILQKNVGLARRRNPLLVQHVFRFHPSPKKSGNSSLISVQFAAEQDTSSLSFV
jgi:hypothetical protein